MASTQELIERLWAEGSRPYAVTYPSRSAADHVRELIRQAAQALTAQAEEIARLRKALRPFANLLPDDVEPKDALQRRLQEWSREARAALAEKKD